MTQTIVDIAREMIELREESQDLLAQGRPHTAQVAYDESKMAEHDVRSRLARLFA
jgi:hypothetical protein